MTVANNFLLSVVVSLILSNTCDAIKCFECNSVNNSACLDMHMPKMNAVIPAVDCAKTLTNDKSKEAFCRKITQTILHGDKTPEVRITRTCGWVKHKRECYKADNMDHLETACQCFGVLCNAATLLENVKIVVVATVAAIFMIFRTLRENV